MRIRSLALSVTALALLSPLAAGCSGDDPKDESDTAGSSGSNASEGVGAEPGEPGVPGPSEPSDVTPDCPFTAKQLNDALGTKLKLQKGKCIFEAGKSAKRMSLLLDPAADNSTYEKSADTNEKGWPNFEELQVPGQGYVAWSNDDLNIIIGYLDNAGEYTFQVNAITPKDAGFDDETAMAEALIDLTVKSRQG